MTESQKLLWGGIAMIVIGLGIVIFGGTYSTGGS